jgi:aryl-alcohol dehydrogenase-like predicted oxidoreductase
MTNTTNASQPAAASGTFAIGGDLPVARLGFGAMRLPFGTLTGPARDPDDGIAVLRRAVELGVNHIDTASFYRRGNVVANELIRRALAPYPDGLVIATKVGPLLGPDGAPRQQATGGQLRGLVEDNLRELGGGRRPIDATRLEDTAARHGATVQQIALAALLAASPVMLLIPGTGSLAHLADNVGAASIRLTPDEIASLAG